MEKHYGLKNNCMDAVLWDKLVRVQTSGQLDSYELFERIYQDERSCSFNYGGSSDDVVTVNRNNTVVIKTDSDGRCAAIESSLKNICRIRCVPLVDRKAPEREAVKAGGLEFGFGPGGIGAK